MQHLRFLAELGAGKLIDDHAAFAELGQLVAEQIGADAISRRVRLVIAEAVVLGLGESRPRDRGGRQARAKGPPADAGVSHDWFPLICGHPSRAFPARPCCRAAIGEKSQSGEIDVTAEMDRDQP